MDMDIPVDSVHSARKNYSRSQWCSAINCTNGRYNSQGLSFFRFPRDEERCKRWVINCRREDLLNKSAQALFQSNILCAVHFEDSQFTNSRKTRLRHPTAVPTLFDVPNPPALLESKRAAPKQRQVLEALPQLIAPVPHDDENTVSCEQPPSPKPAASVTDSFEKIASLKKKIDQQRKAIKRLQSTTIQRPQASQSKTAKLEIENIKSLSSKYLSSEAHAFFSKQLDLSLKKGKRWNASEKSHALSLYHASPKAYRLLQKLFSLPSVHTLRRAMKNIEIYPGFPQRIVDAFKVKVKNMCHSDRQCILVFDEMTLKASLNFNTEKDYIEGLEDFGLLGRTEKVANHATVFLVRGIVTKWKQPLGYFLSQSTMKPMILKDRLLCALDVLHSIGLVVKAVICDQGSNNCAVFRGLNVTPDQPFFSHKGSNILVLYDPPHLLKNIRNNLFKHNFYTGEGVISWSVIREFYVKDKEFPLRMAPKIKNKHVELPTFSHLRVSLAAQVLSHSVASGIGFLCQVNIFPPAYMHTANFISKFDRLFNAFNSTGGKAKAPYKHPISATSSHIPFLNEVVTWLKELKYGQPDAQKSAMNLLCVRGWVQTIQALILLVEDVTTTEEVKYILTNRLNQDCVENLFSVIRGKGGHRDNPNPQEFRLAFRQVMVDKILLSNPGTNCKEDLDSILLNLTTLDHSPNAPLKKGPCQEQPQVVSLVRSARLEGIIQLENIVAYISGYILRKILPLICNHCRIILEEAENYQSRHLTLVAAKEYDGCTGEGLARPSTTLIEAVAFFFKLFSRQTLLNA